MSPLYLLSATSLSGDEVPLSQYRGQVLLIVNVASRCGFTPQYEALESLYRRHQHRGFAVLGFPCNQFGHQEPGDAQAIRGFCDLNYQISFPLFAKTDVNGPNAHPLYQHLKAQARGILGSTSIKWNFTKFLVDRHGIVVRRYAPTDKPEAIEKDIERLLQTAPPA